MKIPSLFIYKPIITRIVMMGDSLSDRGTLNKRMIFGYLPLAKWAGLTGVAPAGRFTNGFNWSDDLSASFTNQFIISDALTRQFPCMKSKWNHNSADLTDDILNHRFVPQACKKYNTKKRYLQSSDIADDIISSHHYKTKINDSYTLGNDLYVQYKGRDFIRCYDEGGLSAYSYRWALTKNIGLFFKRLTLTTLEDKRKKIEEYDNHKKVSANQKKRTLVIEWSGANDLITVNDEPTIEAADKAIKARLENVELLIKNGYRNFCLFDLPDISLTPRYQNKMSMDGKSERLKIQTISNHFNAKFKEGCNRTQINNPQCTIRLFKCSKAFTEIYNDTMNNTGRYPGHFSKDKLHIPYISSDEFVNTNGVSPATGYMFWDDIHPSADMHALLADDVYNKLLAQFLFQRPKGKKC